MPNFRSGYNLGFVLFQVIISIIALALGWVVLDVMILNISTIGADSIADSPLVFWFLNYVFRGTIVVISLSLIFSALLKANLEVSR
jgi:hypothetical protein